MPSVPLDLGLQGCGWSLRSPRRAGAVTSLCRAGNRETMVGSTWTAKSSMSAGLARAASRAVVVVPMLEPTKRG